MPCQQAEWFLFPSLGLCFAKYTPYAHDLPAKIQVDARGHMHGLPDAWAVRPGMRMDPTASPEFSFETLFFGCAHQRGNVN